MTSSSTRTLFAAALAAGLMAPPILAGGNHGRGGHGHAHGAGGHGDHGHAHAAPDPHQGKARHGGKVLATGDRLFEVTMRDRGIRVYPMDASGQPRSVEGVSGSVLLKARRGRRMAFDLKPVAGSADAPGYLEASADLSGVKDGSRTAMFSLRGLGGETGRASVFTRFARTHHEEHGHGHGDHAGGHDDHAGGHGDHGHGHDDHAPGGHGHDH